MSDTVEDGYIEELFFNDGSEGLIISRSPSGSLNVYGAYDHIPEDFDFDCIEGFVVVRCQKLGRPATGWTADILGSPCLAEKAEREGWDWYWMDAKCRQAKASDLIRAGILSPED